MNYELNREIKELEKDRINYATELENERNKMSILLKGDMGKDIDDVLSGHKKIKISFFNKLKFKLNYYLNMIFDKI